jgi:DNA-binding IclR family transcriptional regulator
MTAMAQQQRKPQSSHGEISQTLDRGLRVLEVLRGHPDGLSLQEVAMQLKLHRTITYRLLNTLMAHRLVQRMDDSRYYLGSGLTELAQYVVPRLQVVAQPELRRLAEKFAATACLTMLDGDEAVVVTTVEPSAAPMHIVYRSGYRHALDTGASGLAILAGRPPAQKERAEVIRARERGYAVSYGEIQQGASGIAAPIRVKGQPAIASIGVILLFQYPETDRSNEANLVQPLTLPDVYHSSKRIPKRSSGNALGKIDDTTFAYPVITAARAIADALE